MSIATPSRPISAPVGRPGGSPVSGGGGGGGAGGPGATIDPVRLIRQHKFTLLVASAVGVGLGIGAYWLLAQFAPQYRSTVTYQGLQPEGDLTQANPDQASGLQELDRFTQTQVRIMTNERLLRDAVQNPKIRQETRWAKDYLTESGQLDSVAAVRDLKEMVSARVITGTSLVEMTVAAKTPTDAATIASAMHDSYWRDFASQTNNLTRERREALGKQSGDLQQEISRIGTQQTGIMANTALTSIDAQGTAERNKISVLQPRLAETTELLSRLETDLAAQEGRLANEGGIQYGDDLKEEVERDAALSSIKAEIGSLRSARDAKRERLGEGHREITQLQNLIDAKEAEFNATRESALRKAFDGRLERTQQAVESTKIQINEMQAEMDKTVQRMEDIVQKVEQYRDLEGKKSQKQEQLREVQQALDNIKSLESMAGQDRIGRMRLLERGRPPDSMAFPRLPTMLVMGLFVSVGLTGAVVVLREVLDQRIKGPSDINIMPRMRLLGLVPLAADDPGKPVAAETAFRECPAGAVAESFRQLRPSIVKRMTQAGHKSLLFIGAMPGSGTTTIAANFAMACAAADMRVLLIDANFRRPALHKVLKLGEGPGLGDVIARTGTLDAAVQQTSLPNLFLLAAGTAQVRSTPERLATEAMTQVVREASEKFDLVILDTAPAVVAGDGLALANRCDASVLVVRAMAERRGLVARIRDTFSDTRAEFLGVIVNAVRASAGGYLRGNIRTQFEYQNSGAA
ncbi:MAG: GumC family protein [Phycisphaerales bacterium]